MWLHNNIIEGEKKLAGVIVDKVIKQRRENGLSATIKKVAPAVKNWYNKTVIQFLKEHEELTEEEEDLIARLSEYCESKLDNPSKLV